MTYATVKCRHCGVEFRFPKEYGKVVYCSASCRVTDTGGGGVQYKGCTKSQYYSKNRRRAMAAGDKIDPYVVYVASGWTCCICNEPVNPDLRPPDLWCATMEHIVPLSVPNGPGHVWSNVGCAHAWCNFNKAASGEANLTAHTSTV